MTLRRYTPLRKSMGTRWPPEEKAAIIERDRHCVAFRAGLPDSTCHGFPLEADHVRASHGTGMKSVSCRCNGVLLCGNHHRYKTEHGKLARPLLLAYLARYGYTPHAEGHIDEAEHPHVELEHGCPECEAIRRSLLA